MMPAKNYALSIMVMCVLSAAAAYGERSQGFEFKKSLFKSYKGITSEQKGDSLWVLEDGEPLLELRDKRHLRFRATADNDHWVGTIARPMDLCWDYSDVNDYDDRRVNFTKTDAGFTVAASGTKPSVEGMVNTIITATRRAPGEPFEYTLESRIEYSLEKWHSVSTNGQRAKGKQTRIQALDFHINRVSMPDLYQSKVPNKEILYDGFVFSADGSGWLKAPKIHIPYVVRPGNYIAGDMGVELVAGNYYGFVDIDEGGWMMEIQEASSPLTFGLCWMFFDVHCIMTKGVPALGGAERAEAAYKFLFRPVTAEYAGKIWADSQEVEWRSLKEYGSLPLFSWDSKFDKLLTDKDCSGSDKYVWLPSSYDCFRDDKTGFDDNYSASINIKQGKAAWYCSTWGTPYDTQEPLKGTYRISVMVKTQDVEGEVRLSVSWSHGGNHLNKSSEWAAKDAVWKLANKKLTGTNDWTLITLEIEPGSQLGLIDPEEVGETIVLEQIGPGQSWFDNVKIEKVQ